MKILITGGAGMIGSHCAEYFANKDYEVLVYDNLMRSAIFGSASESVEYNWKFLSRYDNVTRVKNDIRDSAALDSTFSRFKPDVVIHTAAQPGVRMSLENPIEDCSINTIGTLNVLESLRMITPEATFLYCSTNKVYGSNVDRHELLEQQSRYKFKSICGISELESIDQTGHTPYGVSKLAGELYVQDYVNTFNIRTFVFRMSCIYGTRQFGFEDQGWIAWFCRNFLLGEPITLFGDGKQVRDVLWVTDLVQAFEMAVSSKLNGGVYNIGGGSRHSLSLLELISQLELLTATTVKITREEWRKADQKVYITDITKVSTDLEWSPSTPSAEGLGRLVAWMDSNQHMFNY